MPNETQQDGKDNSSKPVNELKAGDKAKDFTAVYDRYHRVVIVDVDHDSETADVLYLESKDKGEVHEKEFEVDPEMADRLGQADYDMERLVSCLMTGKDPDWEYLNHIREF